MKKCDFCRKKFDNNCFIYCNNCMDLRTAITKWNNLNLFHIDFEKILRR